MAYRVEILDRDRKPITSVHAFAPLDNANNWLEYSEALSNVGECKFRVGTKDQLLSQYGDILQPFFNHVRVYRYDILVWSGVIISNPRRSKNYIEVHAKTYMYMLTTVLVKHDVSQAQGDGKDNFRTFKSGTMADAVRAIMTEAKDAVDNGNIVKQIKLGTIDNPNFPKGYTKADGTTPLTGGWVFSDNMTLQFDYRDILFVLQNMANYPACDFELTEDLVFNFKQYIGNKQPNMLFSYGNYGSIEDYNALLDGENMANDLTGVAVDYGNQILHATKQDSASIAKYGRIQGVAAYIDVKNANALQSRLTEQLRLTSTPDTELHILLNERAYPLGQYGLGDIVTVRVKDHIIDVNQQRRIVGIKCSVHLTGKERIRLITNPPKDNI